MDCGRRHIEAGTAGRIRIPGGLWLPFEVGTCGDFRWTWRVARVPATGRFVEPVAGADRTLCRAGFELPLYGVGYAPGCCRALGRVADLAEN